MRSRCRLKSAWVSELITVWRAKRPCLTAFCETAALPLGVRGHDSGCGPREIG